MYDLRTTILSSLIVDTYTLNISVEGATISDQF